MHPLTPPLSTILSRSESNGLKITQERIKRQLTAVTELLDHNAKYLESFERSWIEHIIREAMSVTVDSKGSAESSVLRSESIQARTSDLEWRASANGLDLRPWSPARSAAQDHVKNLLATSRSLNSANSLLSCCHDRWLWLQSLRANVNTSQSSIDDFQELQLRRRQQRKRRSNTSSQPFEHIQTSPQRDDTNSVTSSPVAHTNNDGSENSLYLVIDDTIEKWRQNAEDALNDTTVRIQAATALDRSPVEQQSPNPHTYQPYAADREDPFCLPRGDGASVPIRTSERRSTFLAGMPPLQSSTYHSCPIHTEPAAACPECHPRTTRPQSRQYDAYHVARSAFQPTLHNSFDKEPIDAVAQNTHNVLPHSSSSASRMRSLPNYHSQQPTTYHTSPTVLPTIAASAGSRITKSPDAGRNDEVGFTQRDNASRMSVHSRSSKSEQTARSRGRRWLEQQSDDLPQQSGSTRRLVL